LAHIWTPESGLPSQVAVPEPTGGCVVVVPGAEVTRVDEVWIGPWELVVRLVVVGWGA